MAGTNPSQPSNRSTDLFRQPAASTPGAEEVTSFFAIPVVWYPIVLGKIADRDRCARRWRVYRRPSIKAHQRGDAIRLRRAPLLSLPTSRLAVCGDNAIPSNQRTAHRLAAVLWSRTRRAAQRYTGSIVRPLLGRGVEPHLCLDLLLDFNNSAL